MEPPNEVGPIRTPIESVSRRGYTDPYDRLKTARFLPESERSFKVEVGHSQFSMKINDFPRSVMCNDLYQYARPYKVKCVLSGNWKAAGAYLVSLDVRFEGSNDPIDEAFMIDQLIRGRTKVPVDKDGNATFKLLFRRTSSKYGRCNLILKFVVRDIEDAIIMTLLSPPFYIYSNVNRIKSLANVDLKTVWQKTKLVTRGDELHIIGRGFLYGPRFRIVIKIGNLYEEVKDYETYSKTVVFFRLPQFSGKSETEIEGEVLVSNDGITHSNPQKIKMRFS